MCCGPSYWLLEWWTWSLWVQVQEEPFQTPSFPCHSQNPPKCSHWKRWVGITLRRKMVISAIKCNVRWNQVIYPDAELSPSLSSVCRRGEVSGPMSWWGQREPEHRAAVAAECGATGKTLRSRRNGVENLVLPEMFYIAKVGWSPAGNSAIKMNWDERNRGQLKCA